jgi:uncharacterized protein (TIGR02217 family)
MQTFPTFTGIGYPVSKSPVMSTRVLQAASGLEYRAQDWTYPRWKFNLPIQALRQYGTFSEWQALVGFILQQGGMFQNFLFNDTTDNTAKGQQIGVGNGAQTAFPLVRAIGSFVEPIYYCTALNAVYLGGVKQTSGITLTQSGLYGPDTVTFSTAPGASIPVTADFTFNFVCRFSQDDPETQLFVGGRWEVKSLQFESCKGG